MAAKPEKLDPVWDHLDRCAHATLLPCYLATLLPCYLRYLVTLLPRVFSIGRLVANRPAMQDYGAHVNTEAVGRANGASQRANCL
jgi:hypothetical protein